METAVTSAKDLLPGKMRGVKQGSRSILIANIKGQYFAIGNICTHTGCTLSDGTLEGKNVTCPCHGSTFDVTSGKVVHGPAQRPEPSFAVKMNGDEIQVSL